VRLWDAASGDERAVLRGHTDWVNSVAFSPDGAVLASGSGWRGAAVDAASGDERAVLRGIPTW
jgi:WD40 repeat protein